MKPAMWIAALLSSLVTSNLAFGQTTPEFHPFLTERFMVGVGAFFPTKDFNIRVEGDAPEEEINFDEVFRFEDDEATFAGMFRWNFGEKWSFWLQGWQVNDSETALLTEDISWEDVEFKEGTFATGGLDTRVARLFFGRKFSLDNPGHEVGIGAGVHWLELEAFLEGQVLSSVGDLEFRRESVETDFPLPNIGGWYHYSWSPNWMVGGRIDWLSASVGDYSGGLWHLQGGINWAPWRNIGFGLYYTYFSLDVDIDKSNWSGSAESKQYGPYLSVTAHW